MATRQEGLDEGRLSSPTSPNAAAVRIAVRVEVEANRHATVRSPNVDPVHHFLDWRQLGPCQRDKIGEVPCQDSEGLGGDDYIGGTKKFRDSPVHLVPTQSFRFDSQGRL